MSWSWKDAYSQKIRSASDAAALINSGDHVTIAMASPINTPLAVVSALAHRASELSDVQIDASWSAAPAVLLHPGAADSWSIRSVFAYTEPEFALLAEHSPRVEFVPMNPSFLGALAGAARTTHVISVIRPGLIFVDDGAINFEQLREWLKTHAKETKQPSLLVRASASQVPVTDLTDIASAAHAAGFIRVVVGALEPGQPASRSVGQP